MKGLCSCRLGVVAVCVVVLCSDVVDCSVVDVEQLLLVVQL